MKKQKQKFLMLICGLMLAAGTLGPTDGDNSSVSTTYAGVMYSKNCPLSTRAIGAEGDRIWMKVYKATAEMRVAKQKTCLLRCFYQGGGLPTRVLYYNLPAMRYCGAADYGAYYN